MFSFLLHFVWEFLQVPTYAGMAEMAHWQGVKLCTSATIGDVGFALTAFWTTSLVARTRHWIGNQVALSVLVFLGTGIALTVGFEFYYTQITHRWNYSDLMPLVPPFGTGLSPLLQWIVIPTVVLWLSQRNLEGGAAPPIRGRTR
ncbi:hypothetical protein PZ895_10475 [Mesorhizobium sp. YIM 152430]|uniref:hypothetical protein n=1 Tax=Mesorhizobium sp. YIM 152430 TaxID=3031761 RepID=UPI0023DA9158|nr:hypothetical protein [Mesorhizobium sp. YIM 152430]MDF1600197.1 hypothetical protein [Mesorhizobium sp. YIM 152430]